MTGTGYTVERGTDTDEFTATVLGRVSNGIAPGVDMIMAEVDSPALERAGGVWAGMSGSPVYASDGRLIGSVSYGLAASSKIAGITPAEDLLALNATGGAAKVKVSGFRAARLAQTGKVSKALASEGFERLPVPVSGSGLARKNTGRFLRSISRTSGMAVQPGGASISVKATSSPSEIFAGSNYVAALSYGDVSLSGLGTTTYVCDGTAIAFGHPFLNAGRAEYGVHPATAVYVQADPVNGPFKVGNPGGVVGTVTRDGTIGLRSTLGQAPQHQFPITTSLKNEDGKTVTGQTVGVYQPYAADIAALHLQSAIVKANGSQGAGSAAVRITVKGTRAGGKPFTLSHSDHFADTLDVSFTAADSIYYMLTQLLGQSYEDVSITSISVTGSVATTVKQYRVTQLEVKKHGTWQMLKGMQKVTAGGTIPLRATLTAYRSTQTVTVPLTVAVPKNSRGYVGTLTLSDGLSATTPDQEPNSLTSLMEQINATPPNDAVVSRIDLDTPTGGLVSSVRRTTLPGAVSTYLKMVPVTIK
ncbi:SpoIVB peptidase S55 domain-containing protein [Kineosporia mesophila]|uniref:SpoIVB peptidase S55 domain-containing protein n=1 Tax=Kineosporia mesophila TaxID=566012 RepID=A0ABP6ZGV7_9ACTN